MAPNSSFSPPVPVNRPGGTRSQWLALRRTILPRADEILPYLREIDENQWYSNFGPLNQRLEARLAEHFGVPEGGVLTVSSATAGLQIALANEVLDQPRSTLGCAIPAFGFTAAAAVTRLSGFSPVFADVSDVSWSLSPDNLQSNDADSPIAAALPVSFFGAPMDVGPWEDYARNTGTAVVMDAAWCFDSLVPSDLPSVVSLHATKVLGVGEGGMIVCRDVAAIETLRAMANFGLNGDRVSQFSGGTNAKMSEYTAAIGLAALDAWPDRRARLRALASSYIGRIKDIPDCQIMPGLDGTWTQAAMAVRLPAAKIEPVMAAFAAQKIEVRQWWTPMLPAHPAYGDIQAYGPLRNCTQLALEVLHLPFHETVTYDDLDRISDILSTVLSS